MFTSWNVTISVGELLFSPHNVMNVLAYFKNTIRPATCQKGLKVESILRQIPTSAPGHYYFDTPLNVKITRKKM